MSTKPNGPTLPDGRSGRNSKPPSCPRCAQIEAPQVGDRARLRTKRIRTHEELLRVAPDSQAAKPRRHLAKELLGFYDLNPRVKCSFPDGTLHNRGYVILTCCDMRIQIGICCGKTWLKNFGLVEQLHKRASAHYSAVDILRNRPDELLAALRDARGLVAGVERFQSHLRLALPGLHDEIARRRILVGGRRRTEVTLQTRIDGKIASMAFDGWFANHRSRYRDQSYVNRHLTGLEVLDTSIQLGALNGIEREVRAVAEEARTALQDEEDQVRIRNTYDRLSKVRDRAARLIALADKARLFFSDENMNLLIVAAEMHKAGATPIDGIEARDGEFHFQFKGALHSLGLRGLILIRNAA